MVLRIPHTVASIPAQHHDQIVLSDADLSTELLTQIDNDLMNHCSKVTE